MAKITTNNPTKFYTHFLYKAIFVSIFLLLLPLLFSTKASDVINPKATNTTVWEFLQFVFVGIVISYGLFSKRNYETQKEEQPDNDLSDVVRLLQVSSAFDDDSDNPSASASDDKVQTWSSQYYRGEPIVVVAKDTDDATTIEKPLFLPVHSLKNRVSESSIIDSNSSSFNRFSSRRICRHLSQLIPDESEDIVLRSPIPWRSRSGRKKVKEEFYQTPGLHDSSEVNTIDSTPFHQSKISESVLNPSSLTLYTEIESTTREDFVQRNINQKSSLSPISPPPHRSENVDNTHSKIKTYASNEFTKLRIVPEDFRNRRRRGADFTIRTQSDTSSAAKSFGTRKETESNQYLSHDKEIDRRGSQIKKYMEEETHNYPKEELRETEKDLNESDEVGSIKSGDMVTSDNGLDVDKKADEFIAKFREQIRLQRIVSVRN